MHYIYKTTNTINGKFYVGKSNFKKSDYMGSGINLNKAIDKYGKENFIVTILEEVEDSLVNEREIYWINKLDPHYNIAKGGDGGDTSKFMSDEQKANYYYKKGNHFRNDNPMNNPVNRKKASDRMKTNNPVHSLEKNPRSRAVKVIWEDGTCEQFDYIKKISETYDIPYTTLKVSLRKGLPIKKYKITSVTYI